MTAPAEHIYAQISTGSQHYIRCCCGWQSQPHSLYGRGAGLDEWEAHVRGAESQLSAAQCPVWDCHDSKLRRLDNDKVICDQGHAFHVADLATAASWSADEMMRAEPWCPEHGYGCEPQGCPCGHSLRCDCADIAREH